MGIEERLRQTLQTHAAAAPRPDEVERRVLDAVVARPAPRQARWRTWSIPVIAAGAVAAVAAALVAVQHYHPSAHHTVAPATHSTFAPTPVAPVSQTPTAAHSTTAPPTISAPVRPTPVTVPGASGVQLRDVTFVGDEVWALAWQNCAGGACDTMVHSADGGRTWSLYPSPSHALASPGCGPGCVQFVRFATPSTGYAFSPNALFMTTDSGANWVRQTGGAEALETLDNNVLRVVATRCDGTTCHYTVETSAIGSASWHSTGLDATAPGAGRVTLSRTGPTAVLAVLGNTGSANTAQLYISHNDGSSWTSASDPCARVVDSASATVAATTAIDASIELICEGISVATSTDLVISTDGGRNFEAAPPIETVAGVVAAASKSVVIVGDPDLYRTIDGGQTWQTGFPKEIFQWFGFESATAGHALSNGGHTFWTTTDAGASWTAITFR